MSLMMKTHVQCTNVHVFQIKYSERENPTHHDMPDTLFGDVNVEFWQYHSPLLFF